MALVGPFRGITASHEAIRACFCVGGEASCTDTDVDVRVSKVSRDLWVAFEGAHGGYWRRCLSLFSRSEMVAGSFRPPNLPSPSPSPPTLLSFLRT